MCFDNRVCDQSTVKHAQSQGWVPFHLYTSVSWDLGFHTSPKLYSFCYLYNIINYQLSQTMIIFIHSTKELFFKQNLFFNYLIWGNQATFSSPVLGPMRHQHLVFIEFLDTIFYAFFVKGTQPYKKFLLL